jgi:NAD/NADP transhydrogenase alpha subunit
VPKETDAGEKRVAVTPTVVRTLLKQGFKEVLVQSSAGEASEFTVSAVCGAAWHAWTQPWCSSCT